MIAPRMPRGLSGHNPERRFPFEIPEDPPTQPRTLRRPKVNILVCERCHGAKTVTFQWFGHQECPDCDGTGEAQS